MSDAKCTPCVAKRVNALIANAETQFEETDREWLETLEEIQLDKFIPVMAKPSGTQALTPAEIAKLSPAELAKWKKEHAAFMQGNETTITPEMAVNALRDGLKGENDFINLMPKAMQEQTRSALRLFEERKTSLIDGIIANTEQDTWTKEELAVYEVEKLEKIAKTAGVKHAEVQVNYSGMGAGANLHDNAFAKDVPLMAPAGIEFKN